MRAIINIIGQFLQLLILYIYIRPVLSLNRLLAQIPKLPDGHSFIQLTRNHLIENVVGTLAELVLQLILEKADLALILVFSNGLNIHELILDFGEAAYLIFKVVYLLLQIFDLLGEFSIFDFLQSDDLLHFTLVARRFHHFLPLPGQFLPASEEIGLQTDLLLHEGFHQIAAFLYLFVQLAALLLIMQDFLVQRVVF